MLLLDFKLPDGNALDFLKEIADFSPAATTIAISAFAQPEETFALGALGVRAFLRKPFGLQDLKDAVNQAITTAPNPIPHIRGAVGHIGLKEMETKTRVAMVEEAINMCEGNRHYASRKLFVSRQFLQHVLRKFRNA